MSESLTYLRDEESLFSTSILNHLKIEVLLTKKLDYLWHHYPDGILEAQIEAYKQRIPKEIWPLLDQLIQDLEVWHVKPEKEKPCSLL